MLAKNTTSKRLNNIDGLHNVNYGNRYHYSNTDNPYAVRKIENTMTGKVDHYDWDAKGNMIEHFAEDTEQLRRLCWTEDNRLQAFMETEGQSAYYNYTASGERNLKFTGVTATIHQNGTEYHKPVLTDPTLYASSLITITRKGYTKHIFEEGKRICSKIGGGFTNTTSTELNAKVPKVKHDYEEQFYIQRDGITKGFETCMSVTPEIQGDDLYKMIVDTQLGEDNTEPAFYYHSDHLGSASYVTASNGAVVQMLNYLPYGEDWVDLQNFNIDPQIYNLGVYKYNGKEKDAETGYHYYGARYYDSEKIGWLSVDPLADKYPSLSPYVYCANNPVILVDPDGREGIVVSGGEHNHDRYKYNFIEPAIKRLKQLKESNRGKPITWLVITAGYSDSDIEKFKNIASDLGVGFQQIGSAAEFTNYLNSKNVKSSKLSKERTSDPITSVSIFGHGVPGKAEFAYNQGLKGFTWGTNNAKQLSAKAFNNAIIDFYTCNSATNTETGKSLGYIVAQQTGSTVIGYRGQSSYINMNNDEGLWAKFNRLCNGFNTNGSVSLPKEGKNATKIIFKK